MKILIISDGSSAHTVNWVQGLLAHKIEVCLFSLNDISADLLETSSSSFTFQTFGFNHLSGNSSDFFKLRYLRAVHGLKHAIKTYKPDLVHAHYISSYGLLAYLSGFRPYLLSAWGSDIMVFPKKSFLHRLILKTILGSSAMTFSTSKLMLEILKTDFGIEDGVQIPFGVEIEKFQFIREKNVNDAFRFIIVKSLRHTYGIDIAIKAFLLLKKEMELKNFELFIYGSGDSLKEYSILAGKELDRSIFFKGRIPHSIVPTVLHEANVFLNVSRSESFGVSVLEASAAGLPVIISNRGGLTETAINNKTGLILDELDENHCMDAMKKYLENRELAREHGEYGQQWVKQNFDREKLVEKQIEFYKQLLK